MLELLENFDYSNALSPAICSDLAKEVCTKCLLVLNRLDLSNAEIIFDQLLYIAYLTNYPLPAVKGKGKPYCKRLYSFDIDAQEIDFTDYLLNITLDKSKNKTYCACVVVSLQWLLSKENDKPLTAVLKSKGLNTTHAGIKTKDLLAMLGLA